MITIAPNSDVKEDDSDFTPLTVEQAKSLREQHPPLSLWWVVMGQIVVGALVAFTAWWVSGKGSVGISAACGAAAVVIPATLFARGVTGQFASASAGSAVLSFFVWEFVKIVVTVVVLFASHRLVANLSWPAMLVGLVVTMKVYWLALAVKRKSKPVLNETLNGKSN